MNTIRGTFLDGKVVFDTPPDWPDGTEVTVNLTDPGAADEYVGIGIREEVWPTTPEGIAALVAKMEQFQPIWTPEEYAEWERIRAEDKAWELANWEARSRKLESLFDSVTPDPVVRSPGGATDSSQG